MSVKKKEGNDYFIIFLTAAWKIVQGWLSEGAASKVK